jgi:hypothetical protein
MRYHTTGSLSEHIKETPEGYLLCLDVAVARTGAQEYLPEEVPFPAEGRESVLVYRMEADVFAPETMASFEGKPVTIDHAPRAALGHEGQGARPGNHFGAARLFGTFYLVAIGALIRGRTVVMVAHRLKTVVCADTVSVLDKGKIVGEGTHDELLVAGGLYARLWDTQQKADRWTLRRD